jgi:hypothetical protein
MRNSAPKNPCYVAAVTVRAVTGWSWKIPPSGLQDLDAGEGVLPFGRQLLTANQSAGTAVIDHVKLSLSNYRACITSM